MGEGCGAVALCFEGRLVGRVDDVVAGGLLGLCGSWGVVRVGWVLDGGKGRCWFVRAWRCGLLGLLMVLSCCLLGHFLCFVINIIGPGLMWLREGLTVFLS